jgi:hypothetical protein
MLLQRRGAQCVSDGLLDVAAFAFRACGQAECPPSTGTVTATGMSGLPGVT